MTKPQRANEESLMSIFGVTDSGILAGHFSKSLEETTLGSFIHLLKLKFADQKEAAIKKIESLDFDENLFAASGQDMGFEEKFRDEVEDLLVRAQYLKEIADSVLEFYENNVISEQSDGADLSHQAAVEMHEEYCSNIGKARQELHTDPVFQPVPIKMVEGLELDPEPIQESKFIP